MKKETSNHIKFKSEIILKSENNIYEDSLKEWFLVFTFEQNSNCICGHSIVKNCIFKNKLNNQLITIGSTCVKKFFGLDYNNLFNVKSIINKFYNKKILEYNKEHNIINEWEYKFLNTLPTFKKLTKKQIAVFNEIHLKIVNNTLKLTNNIKTI